MSKFITQFNYQGSHGEDLSPENLTAPNQEVSIRELITRFSNGIPLNAGRQVYYDGTSDDEAFIDETLNPDFDFTDAQRIIETQKRSQAPSKKEEKKLTKQPQDVANEKEEE